MADEPKTLEELKAEATLSSEELDRRIESNKELEKLIDNEERLQKLLEKRKNLLEQQLDYYESLGEEGVAQVKKIEEEIDELNKRTEKLSSNFKKAFQESIENSIKSAGKAFTDNFIEPLTVGATLRAIPALDKLRAEFVKNTGAAEKYVNQITKVQGSLTQFGIKNAEASQILAGVYLNFNKFNIEQDKTNEKLIKLAGQFTKLGVPADQLAKNVSRTSAVFGITADQAMNVQNELAKTSLALNETVSSLNQEFLNSMKNFAVYGKGAVDQFANLKAIAKATTVEMSTLEGISERLTTFEATGEFAGRMNAIVGQDLFDAVTLASLEGAEKVNYIQERLRTLDIEGMSPQRLRALSKSAGIDIADLTALGGKGMGADVAKEQEKVAKGRLEADKLLTDTAQRATTSQEKLEANQEKFRNTVIDSTGALTAYKTVIDAASTATGFLAASAGTAAVAMLASSAASAASSTVIGKLASSIGGNLGTIGSKIGPSGVIGGMGGLARIGGGIGLGAFGIGLEKLTAGTKYQTAGAVGGRALQGAGIGMLLGPVGAAIGGLLGGALGYYQESQKDQNVQDFSIDNKGNLNKSPMGSITVVPHKNDKIAMVGGTNLKDDSTNKLIEALNANTRATIDSSNNNQTLTNRGNFAFGSLA